MSEFIKFTLKTLIWKWLQFCASLRRRLWRARNCKGASLVLVPCEPVHVIGSRGDEAMVYAILDDYKRRNVEGRIAVVVSAYSFGDSDDGRRLMNDFPGIEFEPCWHGHFYLNKIYKTFIKHRATEVYAIGADCMDGYYDSAISFILLASADLATRLGIQTKITGFSFNEHPTRTAVKMFRHVTPRLVCNVRDPESLSRLKRLSYRNLNGILVADVAFMLKPVVSPAVGNVVNWIEAERNNNRIVIAFNVHGMLIEKSEYDKFVCDVADALREFIGINNNVSIVLVPHDYRPQGDNDALTKIAASILSPRIKLVSSVLSAMELKALMGHVDGLFTSRMHLGIAALGQGKPISGFSYQGKFEGLFMLFGLPPRYILNPREVLGLKGLLSSFVDDVDMLTRMVCEKLPYVQKLSMKNLQNG